MHLTRLVLGVAGVPLLSGCMLLGGMRHRPDALGVAAAVEADSGNFAAPLERPEARSGSPTLVTAEDRTGTGADGGTVPLATEVGVGRGTHGDPHDWLVPVSILGGLAMLATMALMMAGSVH